MMICQGWGKPNSDTRHDAIVIEHDFCGWCQLMQRFAQLHEDSASVSKALSNRIAELESEKAGSFLTDLETHAKEKSA